MVLTRPPVLGRSPAAFAQRRERPGRAAAARLPAALGRGRGRATGEGHAETQRGAARGAEKRGENRRKMIGKWTWKGFHNRGIQGIRMG